MKAIFHTRVGELHYGSFPHFDLLFGTINQKNSNWNKCASQEVDTFILYMFFKDIESKIRGGFIIGIHSMFPDTCKNIFECD